MTSMTVSGYLEGSGAHVLVLAPVSAGGCGVNHIGKCLVDNDDDMIIIMIIMIMMKAGLTRCSTSLAWPTCRTGQTGATT